MGRQCCRVLLCSLLLGCAWSPAQGWRELQEQQQSATEPGLSLFFTNLTTRSERKYAWSVTADADTQAVNITAKGSGWEYIRFTVTYARQSTAKPMLVLTGQLHIENEDEDNDVTITTPRVTISPTGSEAFNASSSAVKCPRLTIPAAGEIICKVTVNRRGMRPLAGSIQARVQTAGAEQGSSQAFDSRAGRFDFTKAKIVTTGEFANVTLYFEQGNGLLKPTGVYGQQPGEDVRIGDSRSFNFTGLYGGLNATQCGKRLQAMITAELTPLSSDPLVQLDTKSRAVKVAVDSECRDSEPKWSAVNRSACGDAGNVCDVSARCFDGMNCCPLDTPVCEGVCCGKPWMCMQDRCVPPGSSPCDKEICKEGYVCLESNVCCLPTETVCYHQCCTKGKHCRSNMCVEEDSLPCGPKMCKLPSEFCADEAKGICCNKDRGETPCSPMCCPSGTNCVNGACTSPAPAQQPVQPMQPPVVVVPTPAPAPVVAPPPQPPVIVPAPPPVDPTPPVQPNNCGPVNCLPWQFCGNRASGTCCNTDTQIPCANTCCERATKTCNIHLGVCADLWLLSCPVAQWCPTHMTGPTCCPPLRKCFYDQCLL